jgi:hypothetical protein
MSKVLNESSKELLMTNTLPNDLALDFTSLLLAGKVEAAADNHWATNVTIFKPSLVRGEACEQVCGFTAARGSLSTWLSHNKIEDISIDSPFVTGYQFALFIDMQIVDLASGKRRNFSEIATFIMLGNKIV